MKRTSVACRIVADSAGNRVSGCGAGWWEDQLPRRIERGVATLSDGTEVPGVLVAFTRDCPRCGGPLVVTGTVHVVELPRFVPEVPLPWPPAASTT